MNIIAVDDEQDALQALERAIKKTEPESTVLCFESSKEALVYAKKSQIDVAFLDIEMDEMSGLSLAKHLKEIYNATNIIFVTGFSDYTVNAFELRVSGYVMKPINPERVREELNNLRNPVGVPGHGIRVRCFGGFGVFVNKKPLLFPRTKSKELLAYLVHKQGAAASSAEIAAILWEDRKYDRSLQAQTQKTIAYLIKLLDEAGIGDMILRDWNSMAIDINKFSCDYYDYLHDKKENANMFVGEYMMEYSWAEATAAYLNDNIK